MLVAVATDDFMTITGHVGRCNGFLIYDVENGKINGVSQRENNFTLHRMQGNGHQHHHGHGHDDGHHAHSHNGLAMGLKDCKCLIANAAGGRLVADLERNGIEVILTLQKDPETAVIAYSKGELKFDDDATCNHH